MFQLAAMCSLAAELNDKLIIPHWQYEEFFPNIKTKDKELIWTDTFFLESNYHYTKIDIGNRNRINIKEKLKRINSIKQARLFLTNIFRILLTQKQHINIRGYFQSEKYFINHSSLIRKQFSLDETTRKNVDEKWDQIKQGWENDSIVVVQIRRRKDYDNDYHGILPMSYYDEAIEKLKGHKFLLFSDDIEWCKKNIVNENIRFVDNTNPVFDMFLGAKCDHAIIANSSFSWWTAWLIENPNKIVIAPKPWYGPKGREVNDTKDMYCPSWTTLLR
jgi:hypothetical protein